MCTVCLLAYVIQVSEEVFKRVYIPRTLDEVVTYERDADMVAKGQGGDLAYQTVTGMKADLTGPSHTPKLLHHSQEDNTSKEPVIMTSQQVQEVVHGQEVDDEETGSRSDDTNSNISSESEDDKIDNSEESGSDNGDSGDTGDGEVRRAEERKAHKKTVKEANRERRKNKIPKHVKKRKEKIGRMKGRAKGK